jgi:hypothetical protein
MGGVGANSLAGVAVVAHSKPIASSALRRSFTPGHHWYYVRQIVS